MNAMHLSRILLCGALMVAPVVPVASAATPVEKPRDKATRLYAEGMEAMAVKDFDTAAKRFDEASAQVDDPILVWNAARAHHQAGHLEEAKARYNQCLTRPDFPPDKRELIAKYLIEIDRAGREPDPEPPKDPVEPLAPAPGPSLVGPLILIGSGIACVAGGMIMHFVAEGDRDDVREAAGDDGIIDSMTQTEALDVQDSANTLDTIGAVTLGIGGAAALGGVVWLVLMPTERQTQGSVHVTGNVLPGGGGLTVFGSF